MITPRIFEMDRAKVGLRYFVIAGLAALALVFMAVWLLLLSRPGTRVWLEFPIGALFAAGLAVFLAFQLRSGRRFKYGIDAEGISVIRDGVAQSRIAWQAVNTMQPRPDGFRLLGANGEHLLDLSHDLHAFDDLRLVVLSKIQKPAPAEAPSGVLGRAATAAPARRYECAPVPEEHVAGSVGFALVLATVGGFFLYWAITLHWRFAIGTAIAFSFLAAYVGAYVLPIRVMQLGPEHIILEYFWRKRSIPIASIKAVAFDDFVGRAGRAWGVAIELHDGKTIKLPTQAVGIDAVTLYGEICALAPGAVKKKADSLFG